MEFWEMAYGYGWATKEQLRQAVKTDKNMFGEISPEEFEKICGDKF